jgi:hypothetical protein
LLFGEFDLDEYRETMGLTILFVAYTLIGVVILLTVLIAVISDSYEKSKQGSDVLFRTTRLKFVAQHETLEEFLRPGTDLFENDGSLIKAMRRIFRWIVLLSLIVTAMVAEWFLVSRFGRLIRADSLQLVYLACVLAMSVVLGIALWIIARFAIVGIIRQFAPKAVYRGLDMSERYTSILVEKFSSFLFGSNNVTFSSEEDYGSINTLSRIEDGKISTGRQTNSPDDFQSALEQSMQKMKDELKLEIQNLEKCFMQSNVSV